jgi:hypothetical protein
MIKVLLPRILLTVSLVFPTILSFGQEADDETGKLPVRSTFETTSLIDNPTIMGPVKGQLQLNILHRFGLINANGISDIFGIYAGSNIRMGLNYGICDRMMIGIGTTSVKKLQDVNWKVALVQQNRSGSVPLSVSYFGNVVIDARSKEDIGTNRFRELHRFSYLTEIIVAKKFSEAISLQVAPTFIYYNAVDTVYKNVNFGVSVGGRVKISDSKSIIFEYDQPLSKAKYSDFIAKPNLGIGLEIGTATHAFQIFAASARSIIPQENFVYNQNDFSKGDFSFGFNITVRF